LDVYEDARWRAHPLVEKHAELVEFMKGLLSSKNVVIRSIDTEGPNVDLRPGKMFETFAISEAVQNRLLKDMPAAEAIDIMAKKYRTVL
jgi:multiple sugar transport system substrate-binding protein